MFYTFISNIAPPVPQWIIQLFDQTPPEQTTFWFYIVLITLVTVVSFVLTGFERRYGTLLGLSFTSWLVLYRPAEAGLFTLNLPENAVFKNGIGSFLSSPGGFGLLLQLIFGLVILITLIRFIIHAFIVYPLKYKMYQHEGSQYQKQTAKQQNKLHQQQLKQQRKQTSKQKAQPKQRQQQPPQQTQQQAPIEQTTYTDDRGNKNDIDFYL